MPNLQAKAAQFQPRKTSIYILFMSKIFDKNGVAIYDDFRLYFVTFLYRHMKPSANFDSPPGDRSSNLV
jgi:hypothetical protein